MSAENPTLEDFGFNSQELMIEVQRETMEKLIKAEAEIARLQHDIERRVAICAELATDNEKLRTALLKTNGILTDETYEPEKRIIYAVLTANKALANEQEEK